MPVYKHKNKCILNQTNGTKSRYCHLNIVGNVPESNDFIYNMGKHWNSFIRTIKKIKKGLGPGHKM